MTPTSDLVESVLFFGAEPDPAPVFEFSALRAADALAWLAEASIVFGLVVLVVLLVRKSAQRRFGAGWAYALWLAPVAALIATLAPASMIELPVLPATSPAASTSASGAADPSWNVELGSTSASAPYAIPSELLFPPEAASPIQSKAPAETSSSFDIQWGAVALVIWLAGALISLGLCVIAQLRFHLAITQQARRPARDELGALFALTAGTPLRAARDFRFTDRLTSPTATGLFRPVILLPNAFIDAYDAAERRVMVLHEAEHLRALHLAHRLAARLIRALLWFHPLAWIGERSFIVDQELACDSAVLVRNTSIRPRTYAETLLKTAGRMSAPGRLAGVPDALGAPLITIKQLKERTVMLERHVTSAKARFAGAAAVVLFAGVAVLAGLTGSIAATDREPADPEDLAEAARAVAEAQQVLREREAELRELLGEDGDYYWWDGDGRRSFGFSGVLPFPPEAPEAPDAPHVRVMPGFDGFGQSFDFTWDWDAEGLDEETMQALREELSERFAQTQEELERALEELNLAELGRADIERSLRRQYQERFSEEEASRAAEAARERAMAEVERARERLEAARENGEFSFVIPSAPDARFEFLTPSRPRGADDEEMIARIEALEEMLGELRNELRAARAEPAPEPTPEP